MALVVLQRGITQGDGVRMSVNISSRYLDHGSIVADVHAALERHGIRAGNLILAVTESLLLEDSGRVEQTFKALKLLGVKLALDDFGTG
jgi:EAL domain-containing protein (putative c-di-GMP-specific phosphodiesterase class I)